MTERIDASIIVKWFHKGESFDAESHILLEKIIELEHDFIVNEWVLLEVVRALVKAGYTKQKVNDAFDEIIEMMNIGALRKIPVSDVLHLAKSLELNYSLYATDAVPHCNPYTYKRINTMDRRSSYAERIFKRTFQKSFDRSKIIKRNFEIKRPHDTI